MSPYSTSKIKQHYYYGISDSKYLHPASASVVRSAIRQHTTKSAKPRYCTACPFPLRVVLVSEHIILDGLFVVFLGLLLSASCVLVFGFVLTYRFGRSGVARAAEAICPFACSAWLAI